MQIRSDRPNRIRAECHLLKPRTTVIPAKAGIQNAWWWQYSWIPACAGMTQIL